MNDAKCLAQAFLAQGPACHWIVDSHGVIQELYGDPLPIFGKPASELRGAGPSALGDSIVATTWLERYRRAFAGETLRLRERRGEMSWNISVFPIQVEGAIYVGSMAREMSAWGNAEQELRYTVLSAMKA